LPICSKLCRNSLVSSEHLKRIMNGPPGNLAGFF
jgi:hypothetical protein